MRSFRAEKLRALDPEEQSAIPVASVTPSRLCVANGRAISLKSHDGAVFVRGYRPPRQIGGSGESEPRNASPPGTDSSDCASKVQEFSILTEPLLWRMITTSLLLFSPKISVILELGYVCKPTQSTRLGSIGTKRFTQFRLENRFSC